jgi:hypothetical protein
MRLEAEEVLLDAALRAGRYREVLADLQARVAEQPLRERRWALLALAQYQAGRQGEARRTLHRARMTLAGELGLDPGPDLVALEAAILRQDPSLVAEAALPEPSAACPYLGLVAYDVADAEAFFGRDAEVAACMRRLATTGVLAVVGPSGSGKSSLVRAGVAAALRREGRPVVVVTPGDRPCAALTAVPDAGPAPVLVVDQCEEAVVLCDDAGEQARFFAALAAHAERGGLVLAMRADRLGELSPHPDLARLIEPGLYLLGAMGEADLRAAIVGPAHQAGLLLEPGLVELLVREVEGEPGALPLLSHALLTTWDRREDRTLTVEGYRAAGGIRGAVAQSAEDLYDDMLPDQRPLVRDLMLRLVAPAADGEPAHRHRMEPGRRLDRHREHRRHHSHLRCLDRGPPLRVPGRWRPRVRPRLEPRLHPARHRRQRRGGQGMAPDRGRPAGGVHPVLAGHPQRPRRRGVLARRHAGPHRGLRDHGRPDLGRERRRRRRDRQPPRGG